MYFLNPKKAALVNSLALIIVGFVSYYYKSSSITALIPVFLGSAIFL
tara:strand:+ start:476 stop:616 length:141 start_codon:yes stop_codon:yes gene_type:complete